MKLANKSIPAGRVVLFLMCEFCVVKLQAPQVLPSIASDGNVQAAVNWIQINASYVKLDLHDHGDA